MDLLGTLELLKIKSVPNVWVDTIWELDFTETEPLDYRIEGEITEQGLEAFKKLYKCLLPFATEEHGNTEVRLMMPPPILSPRVTFPGGGKQGHV
ncbi:UNVERIFIED_CONTAM: hypothetical protein FKN15_074092 [Acipenser sinensis]